MWMVPTGLQIQSSGVGQEEVGQEEVGQEEVDQEEVAQSLDLSLDRTSQNIPKQTCLRRNLIRHCSHRL